MSEGGGKAGNVLGPSFHLTSVWFKLMPLMFLACIQPAAARGDKKSDRVRRSLERAAIDLNLGHTQQAMRSLAIVEEAEPLNPWLWYYKGVADAQWGRPYVAMDSLDRAVELLGDPPDESLAIQIRAQRRSVRQDVLHLSLRLGTAYDTNVTFFGGDVVAEGLIANEEDGAFGSQLSVSFSPIKNDVDSLTVGLNAANLWQFRVDTFDVQDYTASVRYARRLTPRLTVSLQLEERVVYLGNEPYAFSPAAVFGWTFRWGPSSSAIQPSETALYYRVESRDYRYRVEPEFDRDGVSQTVGVAQGFRFRPIPSFDWYWTAQVGYRFEAVQTRGTEFDRRVHVAQGGVSMPLVRPTDATKYLLFADKPLWLAIRADWEVARYRNGSLNDRYGRKRVDRIGTYSLTLSQRLREDLEKGDVTLHTVLQWSDANSGLRTTSDGNPFTYDKFVFGLQIEWSW